MTLKVPYNFVPLNEKVVKPYWIDYISHDVPFEDGKNGTLTLTLTAESPIFVREGAAKDENSEQKTYGFERDANGNYFLPGSSTRGMIRSLVETLSFGRMIGRVSERRYALRDLSGSMKDEYLTNFRATAPEEDKIRGGWLRFDNSSGKYLLKDADVPGRISHRELERTSGVQVSQYFTQGGAFRPQKDEEKAAKRKYLMFEEQQKSSWFEQNKDFVHDYDDAGRKVYNVATSAGEDDIIEPGRIVFTGQPGPRHQKFNRRKNELEWKGKHLEFIFWEFSTPYEIEVPKHVVEDFKFAYFDDDKNKQSVDYEWRKKQLEAGEEIPVFWKQELDRSGQPTVKHFGLSYLYKLPYDNTVEDSIRHSHGKTAENYDLADAIFGMAGTSKKKGELDFLKGRVQFSHAKVVRSPTVLKEEKVILGEPRASFYPTYMAQKVSENGQVGSYKTFMDDSPIAGRKRYPVLEEGTRKTNFEGIKADSPLITKFLPLDKGTKFECELQYHNLREVELGALLSAITLHGTQQSRHQIGMGKPLGFGKVKVEVDGLSTAEQQELMLCYEAYMDMALEGEDNSWRNSAQVKEVIALTVPVGKANVPALNSQYPYNTLTEFRAVKQGREGLRRHSDEHDGLVEIDLEVGPNKQACLKKLEEDKARFDRLQPMTDKKASELTEQLEKEVKGKIEIDLGEKIENLEKYLKSLQKDEDQNALKARKKARAESAQANGLDLSGVKPGRDPMKQVKNKVERYLKDLDRRNSLEPKEYLLPVSDHDELINKIKELHASGKARKTDFGKRLSHTIKDIQVFLGEEITKQLFKELEN